MSNLGISGVPADYREAEFKDKEKYSTVMKRLAEIYVVPQTVHRFTSFAFKKPSIPCSLLGHPFVGLSRS